MMLSDKIYSIAVTTAFWKLGFDNPEYPFDEVSDLLISLSKNFRSLSVLHFLKEGSPEPFFHNLVRSARLWETYALRCQNEQQTEDYYFSLSTAANFYIDAVAAGDKELATKIITSSPTEFRPNGYEYRNNYCYGKLLLMLHNPVDNITETEDAIDALFEWCGEYIPADEDSRLLTCKALLLKDQELFDEAFEELLLAYDTKIENDIARGQFETADILTARYIYIDAIALLKLARHQGLNIQSTYAYCPALALQEMQAPLGDV